MLNSEQLYDLINSSYTGRGKRIAECLGMALNDWPKTNLCEPEELITELKKTIGGRLTYDKLNSYSLSLNPMQDPWKVEALSSIIQMFDSKASQYADDLEYLVNELSELERKL